MSNRFELQVMKILLVEDNAGDARLMQEELRAGLDGQFELTLVEDLKAALKMLSVRQPEDVGAKPVDASFDAMLLDLNLPDSQGLETFQSVHSTAPWLPVVVLTGLEDEGTGLRAVQEGAQDYLVKGQVSGPVVARSLRFAVERNRSLQWHRDKSRYVSGGRIISFLGVKGGVGTTTLALNTAAVLAHDKLVIAVELRADYGSFASHFRKLTGPNLSGLYRMDEAELSESLLEQHLVNSELGFYLMFGPQSVADFHEVPAGHAGKMLSLMTKMGDFVILDLPPSPDVAQEVIIRRSNAVVLVSERDDSSLMSAKMTIERLLRLGVSSDALSVTVVSKSPLVDAYPAEKIEAMLKVRVLGIVPPAPDVCATSQKAGTPLVIHRPRSAPANMLTSLAQRTAAIAAGTSAVVVAQ
ncbi:MAG: response regulator [Acidobacteriia bacterium]|nr:response regulator [Terriglobia bacterium]